MKPNRIETVYGYLPTEYNGRVVFWESGHFDYQADIAFTCLGPLNDVSRSAIMSRLLEQGATDSFGRNIHLSRQLVMRSSRIEKTRSNCAKRGHLVISGVPTCRACGSDL